MSRIPSANEPFVPGPRHTYLDLERRVLNGGDIYETYGGRHYLLFPDEQYATKHALIWYPTNARGFENPNELWRGLDDTPIILRRRFVEEPSEDLLVYLQQIVNAVSGDVSKYYFNESIAYLRSYLS